MCGLAGFISKIPVNNYEEILLNMGKSISHRGPDDFGIWYDENCNVGFSHRRLSILDLSSTGHQPMVSQTNQFIIVFNGEIYNHLELRKNLENDFENISWNGHSDTETILMLFEKRGIVNSIELLIGMFAIVVYDLLNKEIYLFRDRIGEKPIYYGFQGDCFVFASELKPFYKHPNFENVIDKNALALFFKYNYIPCPYSIYKNIFKLEPGSYLIFNIDNFSINKHIYWDFEKISIDSSKNKTNLNYEELKEKLNSLIEDSVNQQMISDVPIGAFLSGGIDSSLIVSVMQKNSKIPINTFTIGFNEEGYNEAEYAKKIADHLNTNHTELYVDSEEAFSLIRHLPTIYDEPFSDSSQIPTYLVSKLAKSKVTVALSGDAGDELFAGYNRYILANNIWPKIKILPLFFRRFIFKTCTLLSPQSWENILNFIPIRKLHINNFGDKLYKFLNIIISENKYQLYDKLVSHWDINDGIVLGLDQNQIHNKVKFKNLHDVERMMATDTMSYLPDDILVKVDRAAMANSLETRVPLLSHIIVEFAWKIPMDFKIKNGKTKIILKDILKTYIPDNLVDRPKMGFGIPLDKWLRGPLKDWAASILSYDKIKEEGILNADLIKSKWDEHQSGKRNWQYHLWDVIVFQLWYQNQKIL
jgi:asparagine synthase (glutamine-hydrolysing)